MTFSLSSLAPPFVSLSRQIKHISGTSRRGASPSERRRRTTKHQPHEFVNISIAAINHSRVSAKRHQNARAHSSKQVNFLSELMMFISFARFSCLHNHLALVCFGSRSSRSSISGCRVKQPQSECVALNAVCAHCLHCLTVMIICHHAPQLHQPSANNTTSSWQPEMRLADGPKPAEWVIKPWFGIIARPPRLDVTPVWRLVGRGCVAFIFLEHSTEVGRREQFTLANRERPGTMVCVVLKGLPWKDAPSQRRMR